MDPEPPHVVYDDSLREGWMDLSVGTVVDPLHAATVRNGSASMEVAWATAESVLHLATGEPVWSGDQATLAFWIHGGESGGQEIRLLLYDESGQPGDPVLLTPAAGQWLKVALSLGEFGVLSTIGGIAFQNAGGAPAAPFYLDDLVFNWEDPLPLPPAPGPALTVNAASGGHPISPLIYGMNHLDEALAVELRLPVRRFGGNPVSRYNWRTDAWNVGRDWFFENVALENSDPASLPAGSSSDRFVEQNRRTGSESLVTIPLMGHVAKGREQACGFRVSLYGEQQSVDPWQPDCGNGVLPDGSANVTGNDPLDTSIAVGPDFVRDWVVHLTGRYGLSGQGGVAFYNMDNEPMLWDITHRDVRPQPVSYDMLRDLTQEYAAAVKAVDPGARVLGPTVWGWTSYFWSGLDRAYAETHGWEQTVDREAHGDLVVRGEPPARDGGGDDDAQARRRDAGEGGVERRRGHGADHHDSTSTVVPVTRTRNRASRPSSTYFGATLPWRRRVGSRVGCITTTRSATGRTPSRKTTPRTPSGASTSRIMLDHRQNVSARTAPWTAWTTLAVSASAPDSMSRAV